MMTFLSAFTSLVVLLFLAGKLQIQFFGSAKWPVGAILDALDVYENLNLQLTTRLPFPVHNTECSLSLNFDDGSSNTALFLDVGHLNHSKEFLLNAQSNVR